MKNSIPSEYMVRVRCMTYNHAPYIEDAMNGFCMQETDFPFVCVIVDDASTDGEPEVIKNYLKNHFDLQNDQFFREEDTDDFHLIFARHKTNLNCYFGVLFLKYNHYHKKAKAPYYEEWSKAKYFALCEGDDYWTHPLKLQRQVHYMENHSTCMLTFHRSTILSKDMYNSSLDVADDRDYTINELFDKWIVPTASCVYRSDVLNKKIKHRERFFSSDDVLYYSAAEMGEVYGMSSVMSTYRVHQDSISHSSKLDWHRTFVYPKHYINIYQNFKSIERKRVRNRIAILFLRRIPYWGTNKKRVLLDLLCATFWDYRETKLSWKDFYRTTLLKHNY